MPSHLFSETWAELAGSVVVGLLWQGTLIGVLVAVALAATRKRSPNLRYALACAGLLLIAALLPANFAWLATRDTSVSPTAATQATADPSPALATPEPAFSPSDRSDPPDTSGSATLNRPARPQLSVTQWYHLSLPWLGRLWAAGIVCFALYDLAGLFALRRLRAKSQAVGEDIAALARRVQDRLGVHARVQVRWLAGISSALVTGFFRTVILLPASMATRMTPDEIEAILAHEFAHIRRWDLWVNAFQRVVEALLFFHPVVWWLSKTIRAERELCCDELALRAYPDRAQYVRALLTLAETTQQTEALALSSHGGNLVNRVRRILGGGYERRFAKRSQIVLLLGVSGVIVVPLLVTPVAGLAPDTQSDANHPIASSLLETPRNAPASAVSGEVAWGVPVKGLQAGLLFEGGSRTFRAGETLEFVLKIRNVSNEHIALDYIEPAQKAWVPDIRDREGTAVPILPPVLSTVSRIPQVSLAPGEARILDRGALTIQSLGWRGPVNGAVAFCESGKHTVSHTFNLDPYVHHFSGLHMWDMWAGELTTGKLDIEIVQPKGDSDPLRDELPFPENDIRAVLRLLSEVGQRMSYPAGGNPKDWQRERSIWETRCAALGPGEIAYLEYVATDWPDEGYRAGACDALGETQQPSVCRVLIECLGDSSAEVRRRAARSLGNLRLDANVQPLARLLLSDPNALVRADAGYALGHTGSDRATPALVSALQHDEDDSVKQAAALALGWITDISALPALKEALPQADGLLRDHIEAAIRNIEDPDFWGLGIKKGVPEHESVGRNEESTRALFEAFLMSERSLTMLPGNMDLRWEDIPVLLELAEDTSLVDTKNRTFGRMLLTEIPAKPFTGGPQSWAVRGMISLWMIEGIRCGYGATFRPPLYGFCFKEDLTQAQCEASDTIHKETLAAYQKWWETAKDLPIEEAAAIDPLLGTGLRWCVPQQPRPPTATPSQPEPRPSAAVPASPISGLPEPPFTIEEVAAYHREKTGTDLPIDKLKQLYTNIVLHGYGKGGDISGIKDDARRALAFEQDELTRLQLYLGLSDGYYVQPDTRWQTQRKNLARVLLTGLREVLQLDLPDEPPKIPTASFYDIHVAGPNRERVMQEFQKKHDGEVAAQQKARKIRDLIDCRTRFTSRLISEYNYRERSPAAYEELYNLALEYLGDETAAKQLREAAESYQGLKSPVPIIRLPSSTEKKQSTQSPSLGQDCANALELIRAAEANLRNAQFKMESQVYQRSPEGELVASEQFSKVEGLIAPGVRARYHVEIEAGVPAVVKRGGKIELSTSHDRMEVSFDGTTQTVRSDSLQESRSTTPGSWQGQRGYTALFSNRLTHVLPLYEAMGLSAYLATIPDEAPEWKVVPSDDASRLTVWFPRANFVPEGLQDKMSYLVTLDLARGGNFVDWKWYLDFDSERPQLMAALEDVRLEQIGGVWLPVHFVQREFRHDPPAAGNSVQEETRTAIEWSHVNAELGPDAFRIVYSALPESYWILAHLVLPKDWSPTQQREVLESVTDYQQIASTEMGKSRYACRFVIPSRVWEQVIAGVRASGTSVSTYTDEDTASFEKWFPKQESWWKDSEGNPVTLEWWNPESVRTPERIGWQEDWPDTPKKWAWALFGQDDKGGTVVYVRAQTD